MVDEVLKINTYKTFIEESQIILPNMSYVKSRNVSTGIVEVEKTGNEPLLYTPLDEQTYSDWFCYENATVCAEQVGFNKIVSSDVHSGCLRIVRTDAMKVDKHHEVVEVINKEIEGMSGNVQAKEEIKSIWEKKDEKEIEEKKRLLPKCETVEKIPCVKHGATTEYERSNIHRVEKIKEVKEMRMFAEGYEENVMKKVLSNPMLRKNMKYATELRTGRPATSQLFDSRIIRHGFFATYKK